MENIEIEFKNLLTKAQYDQLIDYFNIETFFTQTNHYLDTEDFILKQRKKALRIRVKNDTYEFTLKEKIPNGNLETNQMISYEDFNTTIVDGIPTNGIVLTKIQPLIVNKKLINHVSIQTKRAEISFKNGLIVLDESTFSGVVDYEIEFEVENFEEGMLVFNELMEKFNIERHQANPKIKRAYDYKKASNN